MTDFELNARTTALAFVRLCAKADWKKALDLTTHTWRHELRPRGLVRRVLWRLRGKLPPVRSPEDLRVEISSTVISGLNVTGERVIRVDKISEVMFDVVVGFQADGKPRLVIVRLVKERAPFRPDVGGTWGVNPASCHRRLK
jgi:hypothetical protein